MDQLEFSFSEEIWKPVVGYEGLYEVSNKGRVRSLNRKVSNGHGFYIKEGRVLAISKTTTGYWKVELKKSGEKRRSMKVHRLVAFAFIPNSENKPNINHIDGNPLNNNVENLEWCTQSENMLHANKVGLRKKRNGFNFCKEKIISEYLSEGKTLTYLSRKYKTNIKTISNYLKKNNIEVRGNKEYKRIYNIDLEQLAVDFEKGLKNKELAEKYNTNSALIATYRHKHKKGELIK